MITGNGMCKTSVVAKKRNDSEKPDIGLRAEPFTQHNLLLIAAA
jgi:hypothetical protein